MLRTIQVDFRRLILCRRYYYSIAGMTLALLLNGITYTKTIAGHATLGECFSEVSFGGFMLLFYMLCVVGGGLDYCMDVKHHYMRYMVIRSDLTTYALSKTAISAIAGYISMLIGQVFFLGMMALYLLWDRWGAGETMSVAGDASEMWWTILTFSLLGALLSVLGLFVTSLVPNIFVGIASPVLLYYMAITLTNKHWTNPAILPACIYFPNDYALFGGGIRQFGYALLVTLCLLMLLYIGIHRRMKRRGENV
ncbi:MAG: hypothetical protein IJ801_02150 [Lachnospiraceae bacterium]|nr:hypothetical protein [Lachnospiraceae bacterium]